MHSNTAEYLQRLAASVDTASNDIERANALLQRSWALLRSSADDRGLGDFNRLEELAERTNNGQIQALARYATGQRFYLSGELTLAVPKLLEAVACADKLISSAGNAALDAATPQSATAVYQPLSREGLRIKSLATSTLSLCYLRLGAHHDSFQAALNALDFAEQAPDSRAECESRIAIAFCYSNKGDGDAALEQLNEALLVSAAVDDPFLMAILASGRADAAGESALVKVEENAAAAADAIAYARVLCNEALVLAKNNQDLTASIVCEANLADLEELEGKHAEALVRTIRTLKMCESVGNRRMIANMYAYKGKRELALNLDAQAEVSLDAGLTLAKAHGYVEIAGRCYMVQSSMHEKRGEYAAALAALRAYVDAQKTMRVSERSGLQALANARRDFSRFKMFAQDAAKHAEATEKARLRLENDTQALKRLSYEDVLTGIKNRRHFEPAIDHLVSLHHEMSAPFAIAMIDIDHFKGINDLYGHAVGDLVLKTVAQEMTAHCRQGDEVCRVGGDEFVMLFQHSTSDQALHACERLRQKIAAGHPELRSVASPVSHSGQISVSIGIAELKSNDTPESLLARADQRLYSAKRGGRNQIVAD